MKIIVAGGTGFIGSALVSELRNKGNEIILLSRRDGSGPDNLLRYVKWDGRTLGPWADLMATADAVINLAGEPIVNKRWTPEQKKIIVSSRLDATRAIVKAMEKAKTKPRVLINASAVGYYGNVPKGDVTEAHPVGEGFLADTCHQWESESIEAEKMNVRTVLLRLGIVLEKGGGVLSKLIPPFQMFAGGHLGNGRQWFPWIHRVDVVAIILFALNNSAISGPINATAPNPVTMREFCYELGKVLKRPAWAPVPSFALKLMLGEMSSVLLGGQKAIPQKLLKNNYSFKLAKLENALKSSLVENN